MPVFDPGEWERAREAREATAEETDGQRVTNARAHLRCALEHLTAARPTIEMKAARLEIESALRKLERV